jgi:hypothetical protein
MRMPRDRRLRALRAALHGAQSIGPFPVPPAAGLLAGFAASFASDALLFDVLGLPLRQFVDAAVFAVVAAAVWLGVQRPEVRAAHDTLTWLNGWETERWEREIGRRLPALPRTRPQLLDALPDTLGLRPLRIELLAARGDTDEAWRRLEALPIDTAWQRFERAALTEWVLWWTDGPPHLDAMRAAVPAIEDEERRLVARAGVAAAEARRAAVGGADAVAPLAALRPELGDRPRRYGFSYAAGVVTSTVLIGAIASLAVLVTAQLLR